MSQMRTPQRVYVVSAGKDVRVFWLEADAIKAWRETPDNKTARLQTVLIE